MKSKATAVDLCDPPEALLKSAIDFQTDYEPITAPVVIEYDAEFVYLSTEHSKQSVAIPLDRVRGLVVPRDSETWKPATDAPPHRPLVVKMADDTTYVANFDGNDWWATEVRRVGNGSGFVTKAIKRPALYREVS